MLFHGIIWQDNIYSLTIDGLGALVGTMFALSVKVGGSNTRWIISKTNNCI